MLRVMLLLFNVVAVWTPTDTWMYAWLESLLLRLQALWSGLLGLNENAGPHCQTNGCVMPVLPLLRARHAKWWLSQMCSLLGKDSPIVAFSFNLDFRFG